MLLKLIGIIGIKNLQNFLQFHNANLTFAYYTYDMNINTIKKVLIISLGFIISSQNIDNRYISGCYFLSPPGITEVSTNQIENDLNSAKTDNFETLHSKFNKAILKKDVNEAERLSKQLDAFPDDRLNPYQRAFVSTKHLLLATIKNAKTENKFNALRNQFVTAIREKNIDEARRILDQINTVPDDTLDRFQIGTKRQLNMTIEAIEASNREKWNSGRGSDKFRALKEQLQRAQEDAPKGSVTIIMEYLINQMQDIPREELNELQSAERNGYEQLIDLAKAQNTPIENMTYSQLEILFAWIGITGDVRYLEKLIERMSNMRELELNSYQEIVLPAYICFMVELRENGNMSWFLNKIYYFLRAVSGREPNLRIAHEQLSEIKAIPEDQLQEHQKSIVFVLNNIFETLRQRAQPLSSQVGKNWRDISEGL